ncbi:MAG: MotA/TolQ/ExbB proton channel family protein, partial [Leptospiraceae bacterium]|nr:MotA/TolQ/ExbB proton channel family protein [Leptospiraceae bacterium]
FRDLASAADAGPQVVMKGISEALVATATGLAVAIPAVMLFNYFSSIIKRKMSNSEEIVAIIQALRISTKGQGQ